MTQQRIFVGALHFTGSTGVWSQPLIDCCPGDWPAIKKVVDPQGLWATVRVGTRLVAVGLPSGSAVDFLAKVVQGGDLGDRVAPAWTPD